MESRVADDGSGHRARNRERNVQNNGGSGNRRRWKALLLSIRRTQLAALFAIIWNARDAPDAELVELFGISSGSAGIRQSK